MPTVPLRATSLPLFGLLVVLAGCQRPQAPDPERPPEPKALTQAIKQPLDQAKGVQQAVDAADRHAREQEAEAEGNTP